MKKILYTFMLVSTLVLTACVKDNVYEGPSTIDKVSIAPEAPTSIDEIVVTATVSGLQSVSSATLRYTINGAANTIDMQGNGKTYTATIPAQPDGTKITYVVSVTNEAGFTTVSDEKEITVGDPPVDFSKLVLNELFGAADTDEGKYIELYNKGDYPIKLKGVTINKDEGLAWTGIDGEVVPAHGFFSIVGAKNSTPRGISSGFSAKKSVLIELIDPNGNVIDKFQRGEKGDAWGNQSLTNNKKTWSRCPNGTGKFMIADGTLGQKNPDTGEADDTVVQ